MKIYLLLATLMGFWSFPLLAQDAETAQTPDVIDDDELAAIPPELQQSKPLNELDAGLISSAYRGQLDAVKAALAKGADIGAKDKKQRTALILAASNGHQAVIELLVAKGADVNATDSDGQSALMYAAKRSFNDSAAYLIENGADVNVQSKKKGITALMLAAVADNADLVELLLASGADQERLDSLGRSAHLLAEKKGNTRVAKLLSDAAEQGGTKD